MADLDTHFFVGTVHKHPKNWAIAPAALLRYGSAMSRSATPSSADLVNLIAVDLIFGEDGAPEDGADEGATPDDGDPPQSNRKRPDR